MKDPELARGPSFISDLGHSNREERSDGSRHPGPPNREERSDGSRHPGPNNREAQRQLPSQVILECEPHRRWNSWYSSYCNVRGRFSSLGRHRFAVVSLTRKTSVATTPHRDWSHLALQLRNAHHGNMGCGQSPLKHSASCLADVSHTQRIVRSRMGMAIF